VRSASSSTSWCCGQLATSRPLSTSSRATDTALNQKLSSVSHHSRFGTSTSTAATLSLFRLNWPKGSFVSSATTEFPDADES
jgi:hypothetical protein